MSFKLLKRFYKKCNISYYDKFVRSKHSDNLAGRCGVCDRKFRNKWKDGHNTGRKHRRSLNDIAARLIDTLFSPGIVFMDKTKTGFCIFCNAPLTDVFNDLQTHLNDSNHKKQVEAFKMNYEASKFDAIYQACRVSQKDDENILMKRIIGNGIRLADNKKFECFGCKFQISDEKQFGIHLTDRRHLKWAVKQLCVASDVIQFHRGVIPKSNGFFCSIDDKIIGTGLDGAIKIHAHLKVCEKDPIGDCMEEVEEEEEEVDTSSGSGEEECSDESEEESSSTSGEDESTDELEEQGSSPLEEDVFVDELEELGSSPPEEDDIEQSDKGSSSSEDHQDMKQSNKRPSSSSARTLAKKLARRESSSPLADDERDPSSSE